MARRKVTPKKKPRAVARVPRRRGVAESVGAVRRARPPAAPLDLSPVPLGTVRFVSGGTSIHVLLGDGIVTVTGGYGGWEEIARPHKKPITHWAAGVPYRMTVPIMFDRFLENRTVQPEIGDLEKLARADEGNARPPKVRCVLPADEPRSPKVDWVIEEIAWEGEERGPKSGRRTRAGATVTLLEFVSDDLIQGSAKKRRAQSNTARGVAGRRGDQLTATIRPRVYTWRKGDTLPKVAQKLLGDKDRARDIAKANDIRDGSKLKVGQKIKFPR